MPACVKNDSSPPNLAWASDKGRYRQSDPTVCSVQISVQIRAGCHQTPLIVHEIGRNSVGTLLGLVITARATLAQYPYGRQCSRITGKSLYSSADRLHVPPPDLPSNRHTLQSHPSHSLRTTNPSQPGALSGPFRLRQSGTLFPGLISPISTGALH